MWTELVDTTKQRHRAYNTVEYRLYTLCAFLYQILAGLASGEDLDTSLGDPENIHDHVH